MGSSGPRAFPMIPYQKRRSTSAWLDRKSTRLNSSHGYISYAVFCLKKKKNLTSIRSHFPTDDHKANVIGDHAHGNLDHNHGVAFIDKDNPRDVENCDHTHALAVHGL